MFLLLTSVLACQGQTAAPSFPRDEVEIGGRIIKLPAPAGFERVDGLEPESDRLMEAGMPDTNRYLGRFEPLKVLAAEQGHTFNAQTLRAAETREISDHAFRQLKQQTKAEIETAQKNVQDQIENQAGKATQAIQDVTGVDAVLKISDAAVLGNFDDAPTSLGFTMAMNVAASANNTDVKEKIVVACIMAPVNGRLIYLYANATYRTEADRQWAEKSVTTWRDIVVASNPRVEGGLEMNNTERLAIGGAIVGAVATFLVMLFKKNWRA